MLAQNSGGMLQYFQLDKENHQVMTLQLAAHRDEDKTAGRAISCTGAAHAHSYRDDLHPNQRENKHAPCF